MLNEEIPIGDLLRSLVLEVHAVLRQDAADPEAVRALMWKGAALKGRLQRPPSNSLMRYLGSIERRIGRAYTSSPGPPSQPQRHAA